MLSRKYSARQRGNIKRKNHFNMFYIDSHDLHNICQTSGKIGFDDCFGGSS